VAVDKRRSGKAPRSDSAGSAGVNHAGYFAVDDPLASATGEPVDMAQVRSDDALIDALTDPSRTSATDPLDERLASLLLSWRDDVGATTAGPLVDIETAASTVKAAPRPRKRQTLGPLAAAAAVLVIAFTGVGLAARDAEPGNPLWGVTKVLYSEKAKSVEAAAAVRTKLEAASDALASGKVAEAQDALEQAQEKLPVVAAEDGQGALVARTEQLIAQLEQLTPLPPTSPTSTEEAASPSTTEAPTSDVTPLPTEPPPDPTTTTPPVVPTTEPSPATTGETTPGQASPGEPSPGGNLPAPETNPDETRSATTNTATTDTASSTSTT
jgi:hypothetical protein